MTLAVDWDIKHQFKQNQLEFPYSGQMADQWWVPSDTTFETRFVKPVCASFRIKKSVLWQAD